LDIKIQQISKSRPLRCTFTGEETNRFCVPPQHNSISIIIVGQNSKNTFFLLLHNAEMHRLSISPFFTWKQLLFRFFCFFLFFKNRSINLDIQTMLSALTIATLIAAGTSKLNLVLNHKNSRLEFTHKKMIFFFFFFFFVLCALSCPSTASAHGNGAGQCTVPADITATGAISGMASRGRDGTNTVTVTPASAAPGAKVQIKVAATEFIGVLGAVYAGTAKVGTHTATATTKTCQSNADAITHSDVLAAGTTSLTWDYTLPATATGSLEVRVVTLNGAEGASDQKFALGKATITVAAGTAGTSTPAAGGSTNAAGTTAAGTTGGATTKAPASTSAASLLTVGSAVVAAVAALLL
jgi:hypothetical protein